MSERQDHILAIDQGTTGSTVLLLDRDLNLKAKGYREFRQIYPQPGWVEHDAGDIWESVTEALGDCLKASGVSIDRIAGIGITNQRETSLFWDRATGVPAMNAIVWQCRRTADFCAELKRAGNEEWVRERTGLVLDPYFSGTKARWMLDHVDGLREAANAGDALFGTLDTYLTWKLTGGAAGGAHVTDVSNASRTMLMDLSTCEWDDQLLDLLGVPKAALAQVRGSSEIYGCTVGVPGLPDGIPVAGIAGDQQAALFGQACFEAGDAKCTYGTGAFILLTTVAWRLGDADPIYALEGSTFVAGAAVQWLRDGLQIVETAPDIEALAASVEDSGGVIFVPALTGLGAPHWRPEARGVISGITRGTTRAHLARATLEGMAFQVAEVLAAMEADAGQRLGLLKVDGGASANNLLMQMQADLLDVQTVRPKMVETTALGAAFLAGLATGVWDGPEAVRAAWSEDRTFVPDMPPADRVTALKRWRQAVAIA
jgi:glycerol kinase